MQSSSPLDRLAKAGRKESIRRRTGYEPEPLASHSNRAMDQRNGDRYFMDRRRREGDRSLDSEIWNDSGFTSSPKPLRQDDRGGAESDLDQYADVESSPSTSVTLSPQINLQSRSPTLSTSEYSESNYHPSPTIPEFSTSNHSRVTTPVNYSARHIPVPLKRLESIKQYPALLNASVGDASNVAGARLTWNSQVASIQDEEGRSEAGEAEDSSFQSSPSDFIPSSPRLDSTQSTSVAAITSSTAPQSPPRRPRTSSLFAQSPSRLDNTSASNSPPTSPSSGRVLSQTAVMNFSRPFDAAARSQSMEHARREVQHTNEKVDLVVPPVELATSPIRTPRSSMSNRPAVDRTSPIVLSTSSQHQRDVPASPESAKSGRTTSTPSVAAGTKETTGFWSKFKSKPKLVQSSPSGISRTGSSSKEVMSVQKSGRVTGNDSSRSELQIAAASDGELWITSSPREKVVVGERSISARNSRLDQSGVEGESEPLALPPAIGGQDRGSVYSAYSIYSLPPDDSAGTPDVDKHSSLVLDAPILSLSYSRTPSVTSLSNTFFKAKAGLNQKQPTSRLAITVPSVRETPDDLLQLGIKCHEEGALELAATYFERSAKEGGGSISFLLLGLSLRHGWGCKLDAALGFQYIQRAASIVVNDLDQVVKGDKEMVKHTTAVQNELVLALYELGVSYRFGWGVRKDKTIAVSYFELAANLGDVDAQTDLAFCYMKGKGVKKDLKKASHYYRMAIDQGSPSVALGWIYKPKYMD